MKFIYPVLGIIFFVSYCIFIMNQQLKEIRSLKSQLAIEKDYTSGLEADLESCKYDVEFMKNGLEDIIYAEQHGLK